MQLIPNANQAHKFASLWAALVIVVLNIAAIAVPALRDNINPSLLAYINVGLAGAVMVLRVLRQQGLISETTVPGLDAVIGAATIQGDVKVTINNPPPSTDATAAPVTPPAS